MPNAKKDLCLACRNPKADCVCDEEDVEQIDDDCAAEMEPAGAEREYA